ncbi:MAG: hypothetical protein IPL32_11115 [Chloracidobacterium sp.]|nr:hypothetical protein [Chloracidobacterium sp.]
MRNQIFILLGFIFALSVSAAAQARSVTNTSLEAYKQERLKNEKEYRENYEQLGLPSPEELERRNERSAVELAELSNKLRSEWLESQRIALQRAAASRKVSTHLPLIFGVNDNVIYSYYSRNRGNHWTPRRHQYVQPGYFAGGQFWPTGSRTPSRPMFAPTRH